MKPRVLMFCQHLLGIGHYVRSVRIADALGLGGFEVVLVSGGMPVPHIRVSAARLEQLPPIRAADEAFSGYVDRNDAPASDILRNERRARLLEIYESGDPQIVITEAFPFGRRQVRHELLPLLERARQGNKLIACSLRDILVPRRPDRERETVDLVNRFYDLVLVHGDPSVVRLEETFEPTGRIAERIRYTGYVAPADDAHPGPLTDEILVSAGGGFVGRRLLQLAIQARTQSSVARAAWRIVAGQALPESDLQALYENTPAGVSIERELPDLASRLRRCRLSVSQAGYNTIVEVLAAGVPAVCMPFATETETEQSTRCEKLHRHGRIEMVPPTGSAVDLARAIDRAARLGPLDQPCVDLTGAMTTARILQEAMRR